MADTYGVDIPSFFDPSGKSGLTYDQLQARRKVAIALAARQRGYPKTIGEGLTYAGERISEGLDERYLREQEALAAARQQQISGSLYPQTPGAPRSYLPGASAEAPSSAPAPAAAPDVGPSGTTPPPTYFPTPRRGTMQASADEGGEGETQQAAVAAATPAEQQAAPQAVLQGVPMKPTYASAADVPDDVFQDWKARIYRNETGGEPYVGRDPYQKIGRVSRRGDYPYGVGQVMGQNIPAWSQEVLGKPMTPQQFLNDPKAQDAIIEGKGKQYIAQFGPEGAAAAWFAGPNWQRALETRQDRDAFGTNILEYMRRYNRPLPGPDMRGPIAASMMGPSGDETAEAPQQQQPQQGVQLAMRGDTMSDAPQPGFGAPSDETRLAQTQIAPQQQPQIEPAAGVQAQAPAQAQPPATYRPPSEEPIAPARSAPFPPFEGEPRQPPPLAPSQRQIQAQRLMNDPRLDPSTQAQAKSVYDQEEGYRKELETRQMQIYSDKLKIYNENVQKRRDYELGAGERALDDQVKRLQIQKEQADRSNDVVRSQQLRVQLEQAQQTLQDAREKSSLQARLGYQPTDKFFENLGNEKATAQGADFTNQQIRLAKSAIDQGVITGTWANRRLDLTKLDAWARGNGLSNDVAANTEILNAAMGSLIRAGVQMVNGPRDPRTTESDVIIAKQLVGADKTLQLDAVKKIMGVFERNNNKTIGDYEDRVDYYLGGTRAERNFQFQATPAAPQKYLDVLLQNKHDPRVIADFNSQFGGDAGELEIGRAARRERRNARGG